MPPRRKKKKSPKKKKTKPKHGSGSGGKKSSETTEDALRRVKSEMTDTCSGEEVLRMAQMMAMVPGMRKYARAVCQVHVQYPKKYKWPPTHLRKDECYRFLFDVYANGTAVGFHQWKLVDARFEDMGLDGSDMFKRLGSVTKRRLKWLFSLDSTERIGNVDTEFKPVPYALDVFRSFRNATEMPLLFEIGKTHVAIGFCDFDELLNAKIQQVPTRLPLKYIGLDACVYSVAKFKVVWEMIRNPECALESVCEVWYSSVWTHGTQSDFKHACAKALEQTPAAAHRCSDDSISKPKKARTCDAPYEHNEEVASYIKAWLESGGVSLEQARQQWFNEKKNERNTAPLNFKRKVDVLEACHYSLTGELLMRQKTASDESTHVETDDSKSTLPVESRTNCGSITMFDNAIECPPHTKEDNVYNVIRLKDLVATWKAHGTLLSSFKAHLLQRLAEVRKLALAKCLTVELFCALIHESKGAVAVEWLRSLKPYSVSWNNCVDYFETPSAFHRTAHAIGAVDCVHFAYSMNWTHATLGAFIIDFKRAEARAMFIEASLKTLKVGYTVRGLDQFLNFPPIDNAINYGSFMNLSQTCKPWANWFFSKAASGFAEEIKWVETEANIIMAGSNPLSRASTCLRLVWSYEPIKMWGNAK